MLQMLFEYLQVVNSIRIFHNAFQIHDSIHVVFSIVHVNREFLTLCVCECVCVCEREREKQKEVKESC